MPLDINLLRDPATAEVVRESERKRFSDPTLVDKVIALDAEWMDLRASIDNARQGMNTLNKAIGLKKRAKEECDDMVAESKALKAKVAGMEVKLAELAAAVKAEMPKIGNLVHESVPVSNDEEKDSVTMSEYLGFEGEYKKGPQYKSHSDVLWMIDGYEPERGSATAGHRGYFLKGPGVLLNQALINYALQYLANRGYTPLQPPYFMNKEVMAGVAQLSQFDEELYHVKGEEGDEKYLIATSEQPICAYHRGEWMNPKELPIKYAGMSTCFRKEAGKHGKDTWGIFRVHQFDKIEQFVIADPEKSWEVQEEMRGVAEEFLQSLGLPYKVINIVSGELNNAAAKKYDIEGWFPSYGEFKELVSCSNCTDYQSRAMETRYGQKVKGEKEKKYVHMLNSTLCALTRTICAIMENYQTAEGVKVPPVLVPFLGGRDFFPFVREPRQNTNAKKMQKAAARKKGEAKKAKAKPPAAPKKL